MTDAAADLIIIAAALLLFGIPLAAAAIVVLGWIYNLLHPTRRRR